MKEDNLVVVAKVTAVHGNLYDVQLQNGMTVRAYRGSRVLWRDQRPTLGDQVEVHLSPYDLSMGIMKRILTQTPERKSKTRR